VIWVKYTNQNISSMSSIILYDLPSRDPLHCWSPNPWKTRLLLNYKKLEYTTMWMEYPQIAPTFKNVGIPPNGKDEIAPYTIPAVRLQPEASSTPEWIMNSKAIASALEKKHPSPSLHLDSPLLPQVEEVLGKVFMPLVPVFLPRIPRLLLNEASVDYFQQTRAAVFGMTLDELEKSDQGGDTAWKNAGPPLKGMAELLNATEGPFLMGHTVSYADFHILGLFQAFKRVGDDVFERLMQMDPAFPKLYEASAEWLKRDDY